MEELLVCKICFNATRDKKNPTLTGPDRSVTQRGEKICGACGQTFNGLKVVRRQQSGSKWKPVGPRPDVAGEYRLCNHYGERCTKRTRCTFAHSREELEVWETLRQEERRNVRAFPAGDLTSLGASLETINVKMCQYQQHPSGCPYGDRCTSAHSYSELRAWKEHLSALRESQPTTRHRRPLHHSAERRRIYQSSAIRPRPQYSWIRKFSLCHRMANFGRCPYDENCTYAHSREELREWTNSLARPGRAKKKNAISSAKQARDDLVRLSAEDRDALYKDKGSIEVTETTGSAMEQEASVGTPLTWSFSVKTKRPQLLQHAFLAIPSSSYFLVSVVGGKRKQQEFLGENDFIRVDEEISKGDAFCVTVKCDTKLGKECQIVVFKFNGFIIARRLRVQGIEVVTEQASASLHDTVAEAISSGILLWEEHFKVVKSSEVHQGEDSLPLYPLPPEIEQHLKSGSYDNLEVQVLPENYKSRLHCLLFIEEYERRLDIKRYDVFGAKMDWQIHMDGQEFAKGRHYCRLQMPVTLDDHESSLGKWDIALMRPNKSSTIYQAAIHDVGQDYLILKTDERAAGECGENTVVDVRFRQYRGHFRSMHAGVENAPRHVVFPELGAHIPGWCPGRAENVQAALAELKRTKLNMKQQVVVKTILEETNRLVPTLVCGPFGTGKTRTLQEAIYLLMKHAPTAKVLVCTHVNLTANNYVQELHDMTQGCTAKLYRFYADGPPRHLYHKRTVWQYCGTDENSGVATIPSPKKLEMFQVIVTTVNASDRLLPLGVSGNHFTHIIVDEAAQVTEAETLIPLSFSSPKTKVVLAGDVMQVAPVVHSGLARRYLLQQSLLERLTTSDEIYDNCPELRIILLENYRCDKPILSLASELFYDNKLVHCHKKKEGGPRHIPPMVFHSVFGQEQRDPDSPSYYNVKEVKAITEEVKRLTSGHCGLSQEEITVVAPYLAHVRHIKKDLRRERLGQVNVQTVSAIQGHQGRALLISTVRTCRDRDLRFVDHPSLGLLSDPKLFTTVVTRAEEWLVVVGNPLTLSSVGSNRGCWIEFIRRCRTLGGYRGSVADEQEFEQSLASAEEMRDFVAESGDYHVSTAQEITRSLPTLPESLQKTVKQLEGASPEMRQAILWSKLSPFVRELHPDNYLQVLSKLVDKLSVEEMLAVLIDARFRDQKIAEYSSVSSANVPTGGINSEEDGIMTESAEEPDVFPVHETETDFFDSVSLLLRREESVHDELEKVLCQFRKDSQGEQRLYDLLKEELSHLQDRQRILMKQKKLHEEISMFGEDTSNAVERSTSSVSQRPQMSVLQASDELRTTHKPVWRDTGKRAPSQVSGHHQPMEAEMSGSLTPEHPMPGYNSTTFRPVLNPQLAQRNAFGSQPALAFGLPGQMPLPVNHSGGAYPAGPGMLGYHRPVGGQSPFPYHLPYGMRHTSLSQPVGLRGHWF